jgi:hypothetical protein
MNNVKQTMFNEQVKNKKWQLKGESLILKTG